MRLIHTSDWQLGKPFGRIGEEARLALGEARLDAIDTIAALARRESAPFVLVAGDVFDNPEPGDRVYRQALSRMKAAADIVWMLLPGNHDPARPDGIWTRLLADVPDNVRPCLEPKPVPLGDDAWLLPAPLVFKRSLDDPTAWFDGAETPPGALRIGLAHGPVREFGGEGAANLLAADRARRAGLAYLALGDWHGHLAVGPATHYSGTPEPDDFGRTATGLVLGVELAGPAAPPRIVEHRTARYDWIAADWHISGSDDLAARLDGLAAASALAGLVVRLRIAGRVSLAERVAIRDRLENGVAHELRWLDLDLSELQARPTEGDLAEIDLNGVLRDAAERLQAIAEEGGGQARLASAALERLYVEHQRARRRGGA